MNVLITGVSGTIGSSLAEFFLADGIKVFGTYRSVIPHHLRERGLPLFHCDLSRELLPDTLPQMDLVVHAAAATPTSESSPSDYVASNITGTQNLLASFDSKEPRKLVFLSTLSLYGTVHQPVLTETCPLHSPSIYGASKYFAECLIGDARGSAPSLAIRLPGVVGAGYFSPWLGQILLKLANNDPVSIYNPRAQFNNIVHFHELYRFIRHLQDFSWSGMDVVNLSATDSVSIAEMIEYLRKSLGSVSEMRVADAPRASFTISTEKIERGYEFCPTTVYEQLSRYVFENNDVLMDARQSAKGGVK